MRCHAAGGGRQGAREREPDHLLADRSSGQGDRGQVPALKGLSGLLVTLTVASTTLRPPSPKGSAAGGAQEGGSCLEGGGSWFPLWSPAAAALPPHPPTALLS